MDTQDAGGASQAPSKVVINGQEYDASEASELIGLGQKTRELEGKWNTSVDKVWPEYGKSQTELTQTRRELEAARTELSKYQTKKDAGTETPTDVRQAREAAKKLGIVLDEDISGYVKKDDLETYLSERDAKREQDRTMTNQVLSAADELEKEIDGADGRPKFNKRVVMAYANAYNVQGATFKEILQNAYNDMHADTLSGWQQSQIEGKKPSALKTLKGGATTKEPKPVKIDDSNFQQALKESLWGKE